MNSYAREIPSEKGSYVLILKIAHKQETKIGKLGSFHFPAGYYAYCGSARGPGGLRARLRHHLKINPKPHWHIDHLKDFGSIVAIWWSTSELLLEHHMAICLSETPGASIPVQGFGSSDCHCSSHLFHLKRIPSIDLFRSRMNKRLDKNIFFHELRLNRQPLPFP